ncbi:DMT family transporter [Arenibaculum sp.]|jgi:drug/metabolite transporter (DMT)-like permease|uniref:DMT family transporter n=1 Tax=Arenibaculum sp. TaxID=2865862 RepID=UPI002E143E0D|nr:DMT family transporter [Arenibaculum sp.]
MGASEWFLLLALSVLWGGAFFFGKVAVGELPPLTVVLGRVSLAAVALVAVVHALGGRMPRDLRVWGAFLVMGAINNVIPFSLIFWGQTQIASGLASILNATTPLFAVVFAHVLTRDERMTPARLVGVAVGIGGVVAMIGPQALDGLGTDVLAQAACLGASAVYALAGIYGRRFKAMGVPPLVIAAGQVTCSSVLMLPLVLLVDRPWTLAMPSPAAWGALVGLALACTALAYVIFFRVLATAGATNLLLVTFLIPVSAILLGTLVLGERLEPRHFVGMALIALGLAAIDGRLPAALRSLAGWGAGARATGGQGEE